MTNLIHPIETDLTVFQTIALDIWKSKQITSKYGAQATSNNNKWPILSN